MRVPTLALLSTTFGATAFILSWISTFGCNFLKFSTTNLDDNFSIQFGIWFFQFWTAATSIDGTYIFETCHRYPDQTEDGTSFGPDAQWKTARAFSIITLIIGGCFFFHNVFRSCRPSYNRRLFASRLEGMGYFLACFSSGMTLILLDSSLCKDNLLMAVAKAAYPLFTWQETCGLSTGANVVISATVFYFLAGVTSLNGYKKEEAEEEGSGAPALSEPLIDENA